MFWFPVWSLDSHVLLLLPSGELSFSSCDFKTRTLKVRDSSCDLSQFLYDFQQGFRYLNKNASVDREAFFLKSSEHKCCQNNGETANVGIRMDHHLKLTTFDFIQSCESVNSFSQTSTAN